MRIDGIQVEIGLEDGDDLATKRRIGWRVKLPIKVLPNGFHYADHFLPAGPYDSLGDVLRKVDQEWGPPDHVKKMMPKDWLGPDLKRLAREAPSQNS